MIDQPHELEQKDNSKFTPTQAEIEEATAEIRRGWNKKTEITRRAIQPTARVEVTEYEDPKFYYAGRKEIRSEN